ncbi:hypothetical protein EDD18DRAFT_1436519 [Armillaria luteobubalina]|uniref:Uncharacterized protein n=1 Tax=Armillaria luteobubalina TaxID=153913 RepID=A0AA39UJ81_9AGAR|nr:hypothetical protein EDD18DRAFT_1436519 [Armillaria luteobubalina]
MKNMSPMSGLQPWTLNTSSPRYSICYTSLTPMEAQTHFPLLTSLSPVKLKLTASSPLSKGNCMVYVLLLEHVAGEDMCYLVQDSTIPSLCLAHRTAIIDAAINDFYDILMCSIKQHDMAPRNLIIWPPRHCSAPFCSKGDCPICFSINPDNVESIMIDFEGSELWDPNHNFYNQQTRAREMHVLREDYRGDWWYGKYGI